MFSLSRNSSSYSPELAKSQLYNQDKFYDTFTADLRRAESRVVIESPFITMKRLNTLIPTLQRLRSMGVHITVNTKPLEEHDLVLHNQAAHAIAIPQRMGVTVLMTVGHHRKIAIIDDNILWEGSLNIHSQNDSCEFMRRIKSKPPANEMLRFIGVKK